MKKETARANKKHYVLQHTKKKLQEIEDHEGHQMNPKKKNLVKKLKGLMKWEERNKHTPKRIKSSRLPQTIEIND